MESQPQNPELRNNPENFHSCYVCCGCSKEPPQMIRFFSAPNTKVNRFRFCLI